MVLWPLERSLRPFPYHPPPSLPSPPPEARHQIAPATVGEILSLSFPCAPPSHIPASECAPQLWQFCPSPKRAHKWPPRATSLSHGTEIEGPRCLVNTLPICKASVPVLAPSVFFDFGQTPFLPGPAPTTPTPQGVLRDWSYPTTPTLQGVLSDWPFVW